MQHAAILAVTTFWANFLTQQNRSHCNGHWRAESLLLLQWKFRSANLLIGRDFNCTLVIKRFSSFRHLDYLSITLSICPSLSQTVDSAINLSFWFQALHSRLNFTHLFMVVIALLQIYNKFGNLSFQFEAICARKWPFSKTKVGALRNFTVEREDYPCA